MPGTEPDALYNLLDVMIVVRTRNATEPGAGPDLHTATGYGVSASAETPAPR